MPRSLDASPRLDRHSVRPLLLAAILFLVAMAAFGPAGPTRADTQYLSDGTGWGDNYKNNYLANDCWDQYNSYSSCYQGTWATTTRSPCVCNDQMYVHEKPQKWDSPLGQHNSPFAWLDKSMPGYYGITFAATGGSDYDSLRDHMVPNDVNHQTYHANLATGGYAYTSAP